MPKSIYTVADVAKEFTEWRATKQSQDPIPENLWEMVSEIYNHYPPQLICKELALTTTQLRRRGFVVSATANSQDQAVPIPESFVHIKPEMASNTEITTAPSIELKRPNGVQLVLHNPSERHIQTLLQTFVGD